ncbi:MAG: class I SAM-dependent methyltransferase [Acidobacteriota bacterium]|nr:class I SAM-dependent methyltransferase [Acidobacteriota bacterium]
MTQPSTKSEIAAAYNEWAETYDTNPNRTRDLAAQVLRQASLNLADRNVIEVGCGTGRNTEWLARPDAGAAGIVALDFSEEMLTRAKNRVGDPRVRFVQHDVRTRWPIADASADLVIAMLILEHVEMLEPFFAETARALRPGGELFICELHPMRQLLGGQAQFTNAKTGEHHRVPAFLHDVSDYVNGGLAVRFELVRLGEWRDLESPPSSFPRLLSLLFRLR